MQLKPTVRELAADYQGRAVIADLNIESYPSIWHKYTDGGVPTALFFSNGKLVDKIVGAGPKSAYTQKLDALLSQSSPAAEGE